MTETLSRPAARAAAAVDAGRIEEDLRGLIRIPSITGSEEAVQDAVAGLLDEIGLSAERIEPDPAAIAADPD